MPISKENMRGYPGGSIHSPEWKAIRKLVLDRAGGACEECKVQHQALVWKMQDGGWIAKPADDFWGGYEEAEAESIVRSPETGEQLWVYRMVSPVEEKAETFP